MGSKDKFRGSKHNNGAVQKLVIDMHGFSLVCVVYNSSGMSDKVTLILSPAPGGFTKNTWIHVFGTPPLHVEVGFLPLVKKM